MINLDLILLLVKIELINMHFLPFHQWRFADAVEDIQIIQLNVTLINGFAFAIGMTMVIISGGIDLSVGSLLALSAVLAARFIRDFAGGAEAGAARYEFAFQVLAQGCNAG